MTNSGNLIREYIYLNGEPLVQVDAGSPEVLTYLHTDHLATPRYGTNSAGSTVWTWDFGAFGKEVPTGSATVNLRFPGQYFDSETGLHYNWNRYYNPATGRYVSSDLIGLIGGLNTYAYSYSNPLLRHDTSGFYAEVYQPSQNVVKIDLPSFTRPLGRMTQEQVNYYVEEIEERWSGQIGKYFVTTKITKPKPNCPLDKANIIFVHDKPSSQSPRGNAYVTSNLVMHLFNDSTGWTAAHEAGHLMNLKHMFFDHYDSTGRKVRIIEPGYEDSIMGGRRDTGPSERDIEDVLKYNDVRKHDNR
ncbi:MAG: hypothetical protein KC643_22705 [Nitrospira sp.]|uniref:RHS repeat-associated core domain-containing protein n=1 Tax=Accumulibacter sp. TaxID=2053492 RepID=UPI001DEDEB3B|nr:RHS repeat-associated core domain-containing protein [Accumulibacter sp.]MCA9468229.1 hypothetical protein [Nitrospira sp.]